MQNKWLCALVPGLLLGATGCPDVTVDPDEVGTAGPIVEFDPGSRIVPFPNNLLLDPTTGKVNLPASCNESPASMATRVGVLNQLDGFGTYQTAMSVTFSEPVDASTLAGRVVLYRRAGAGGASASAIPVLTLPGTTTRFSADCASSAMVDSLTIVPLVPLDQQSIYTVALLDGIATASGTPFGPSFTWALIRQAENPVTIDEDGTVTADRTPLDPGNPDDLASLRGIDLLWKAHSAALAFLGNKGHTREQVLLAWEFKTQTTIDPLDPEVAGSPAAQTPTTPLVGPLSLTCDVGAACPLGIDRAAPPWNECPSDGSVNNTQCFLRISLGRAAAPAGSSFAVWYQVGTATCAAVGCAAVGDVVAGTLVAPQYQTATPNAFDATKPIPGPWSDPRSPRKVADAQVPAIAFLPATAAPATGYPTVVYGHGLGSNKESLFAIGPQLAAAGYASVAIDFVAHGARAVRTSNTAALGCADVNGAAPSASSAPQCFAPFLSPNLAGTRDNIRQSVLDVQRLVAALEACGVDGCDTAVARFSIDPTKIQYAGISLGGIIGSVITATTPAIESAVLNVAGAGWADIFENTETLAIQCSLVNGLIDAGILVGEKSDATFTTGLCTTDAWKSQPGYRQFSAIARWVLDPADPANFGVRLAAKTFLIQEVVGDTVVPNLATERLAALTGLTTPAAAAPFIPSVNTAPSPAITMTPTSSKWLTYTDVPAEGAFPGNTFEHASLLRPAAGAAGQLGTARLQTDAIAFLSLNR